MALDAPMPRRFTRSVPLADILAEMAGFGLGNPDDLTASPSLHQPSPTIRCRGLGRQNRRSADLTSFNRQVIRAYERRAAFIFGKLQSARRRCFPAACGLFPAASLSPS